MISHFFLFLIFFCNFAGAEYDPSDPAANALVAHQGHIGRAVKDLTSSDALQSIAIAAATAGAIRGVGIAAGVPTSALAASEKGVLGHLQRQAITQGVTAGINLATGTKPEEALRTAALGSVAGVLGGIGANYISRVFDAKLIDSFSHKLAHSVLGAGTGAILAGGRGAVAGAIAAPIVETIAIMMKESPNVTMAKAVEKAQGQGIEITKESLSELIEEELQTTIDIARLGGAVTALLAGQDVGVAITVGTTAVENNFTLSEVKDCLTAYAEAAAEQLDSIKATLQELASDQLEKIADILEHLLRD